MKFPTLRMRTSPAGLLIISLCLVLIASVSVVIAQTAPQPAIGSAVHPFDATNIREPAEVGTVGLVQAGDNPAWARKDFDDSRWLPIDSKTRLSEYFPHNHPDVVWQRLHIKVAAADPKLALQAYFISRAFEVYVNGQKLMESGRVEPFVPYTRDARMIVRIPEAELRTGFLVVAIRARAPQTWWTSSNRGFFPARLAVGDEGVLRDRNMLTIIGESAADVLYGFLALGVGLVALALFIAQRNQVEYLWVFLLGAYEGLSLITLVTATRNLPASWSILISLTYIAEGLGILLVFQAFLRERFSRLLWLFAIVALLIRFALQAAGNLYGNIPAFYVNYSIFPFGIVLDFILPWLVWMRMRCGNREAGILLIPLLFYSMEIYAYLALDVLELFPPLHSASNALQMLIALHIGILQLPLDDIDGLAFFFSLAIIMVLRSARTSRQQAVLEGEMAAAREVQQVILPEKNEAVPGFTIESEYRPAREVGGDFFQIIPDQTDGSLLIVAGDVTGRG
ncbi:PP2C family protein-serine/threonine phosphatase [Acidicapsa acidisoli]|uniref:PP2C family protein-serine/threonine phosphatase n=1 Tax=Acidicapsa acidisoli TaxID=1615681 RepID=UPI0021E0B85D|nr:hypothetical protein [Acidicapsa acidisoli]